MLVYLLSTLLMFKFRNTGFQNTDRWPKERPKYLQFHLYKEDLDHTILINQLSRQLKFALKSEKFTFAGTKDKRARTVQRVTVPWVTPDMLTKALANAKIRLKKNSQAEIGDFKYVTEKLDLGQLKGNRFCIALRNVEVEVKDGVDEAMDHLKRNGFLNYYGLQRFGTGSVRTHEVGVAIMKERWEEVCQLILRPQARDTGFLRKVKEFWWQYRKPGEASKMFGRKNEHLIEARLMLGLKMCKNEMTSNAVKFIPKYIRLMYLHAFQSYIFNRALSERVKRFGLEVMIGDLFIRGKDPVAEVTPENKGEVTIRDVVMPLPGHSVKYPDNEVKVIYESLLEEREMTFKSFNHRDGEYSLGGDYRKILGFPEALRWREIRYKDPDQDLVVSEWEKNVNGAPDIESESEGEYRGVIIEMSLLSSQYATMALREATKTDTGKAAMSKLTEAHRKRPNEEEAKNGDDNNKKIRTDNE